MLRPTDNLHADHALMARAAEVLAAIAAELRAGGAFPAEDCTTVLRFHREFVLAVHMRKEHEFVYPAVAMRADEPAAEHVGELLRLSEQVAELTQALVLFWEPAGELTAAERAAFAATADVLVARLRAMQRIEEHELFPACNTAVPTDDQLGWQEPFARLERARGSRAEWAARIDVLARRWLP